MLLAVTLFPMPAIADPEKITEGDVEAVLYGFLTGGRVILSRGNGQSGVFAAPADDIGSKGAIRPFAPWDGAELCVEDWHVIVLGMFDGGDSSYTYEDASAYLSQVEVSFVLDGKALASTRTAVRRFLDPGVFGFEEAYGMQVGTILAPEALGIGEHDLTVHVADSYGDFDAAITFSVEDEGAPACN